MDAVKFEWLITNKRHFFVNATVFDDLLEGTTPEGVLEWWNTAAANAVNDEQRNIYQHNCRFMTHMAASSREHYYVSCWHMNEEENLAMWTRYTTSSAAVAIRTTYSALRESLPGYVRLGKVRYIDYATERLPMMNMFEYIMHKRLCFNFEREVRAVVWARELEVPQGQFFESEIRHGFRVYLPPVEPSRLVRGIILHPQAPSDFQAQIIDICLTNGLPSPVPSKFCCEPTRVV
jgi:hypothetical protein